MKFSGTIVKTIGSVLGGTVHHQMSKYFLKGDCFMISDTMIGCKTGIDYENKVVSMLLGLGFKAQRVGKNDNGVDIFASKFINKTEYKFNIQCKYYNTPLGKAPIQQVFTGTSYYNNGGIPVVITNNSVTYEARLYAKELGVEIIADIEQEEMRQVIKTKTLINRNQGKLLSIMYAKIMNDPGLIPDIQSPKKTVKSKKEELVKEIVSKYDMAEEMSKEAARLSLEAANKTQEALRLQKEAMLMNLEYG